MRHARKVSKSLIRRKDITFIIIRIDISRLLSLKTAFWRLILYLKTHFRALRACGACEAKCSYHLIIWRPRRFQWNIAHTLTWRPNGPRKLSFYVVKTHFRVLRAFGTCEARSSYHTFIRGLRQFQRGITHPHTPTYFQKTLDGQRRLRFLFIAWLFFEIFLSIFSYKTTFYMLGVIHKSCGTKKF